MIIHIEKPNDMSASIKWLLKNYKYDEKAVKCYMASLIDQSVPVDFIQYYRLEERYII